MAIRTAPTISIVAPVGTTAGSAATFAVTTSVAAGSSPISAVDIVFGDGSGAVSLGNLTGTTSVTHVYLSAGTYTATVTLVDASGERVSTSAVVRGVPAVPPSVNIVASPATSTVDQVVGFTASVSGSTVPVARFDWTFGDGEVATTSGTSVSDVSTTAGTRAVTVTATTVEGVSGSSQLSLVVEPTVFAVNLSFSPSSPTSGSAVTFTATVAPPTTVVNRYDWKFGDTTVATGSGNSIPHTYTLPVGSVGDSFTVEVTAFKAIDGTTTSSQVVVFVRP